MLEALFRFIISTDNGSARCRIIDYTTLNERCASRLVWDNPAITSRRRHLPTERLCRYKARRWYCVQRAAEAAFHWISGKYSFSSLLAPAWRASTLMISMTMPWCFRGISGASYDAATFINVKTMAAGQICCRLVAIGRAAEWWSATKEDTSRWQQERMSPKRNV